MPPPSSGAWRMSLRSTPDPTRSVSRRFAWRREEQAAGGRGKGATRRLPGAPSSLRLGEYERNGTANLFIISEPLAGWRHITASPSGGPSSTGTLHKGAGRSALPKGRED